MAGPDLNLLIALDALLAEGNVSRAAERLQLSPSAMSRTLARLRQTTGDPLLVRAGRGLVPTPRAVQLRAQVGQLVQDASAALRPVGQLDLGRLLRSFTLRSSEGFVENFGPALVARVAAAAPGVRLRFVQKPDKHSAPLREGAVDLETGVVEATTAPELRVQALFRDELVGVVRAGHALAQGEITPGRYAAGRHVNVSREGLDKGPIDEALAAQGLARGSDLIASVPQRHTGNLRAGMHSFALPVAVPAFTVSLLWHPRMDADLAHRWLRGCVREVCGG